MDIDPTKYYIGSSSHSIGGPNCAAESSAYVNHAHKLSSASFAALDSAHLDKQVSARLHCIAESAPDISVSYDSHAHSRRGRDSRRRSSAHVEVRHSDRRGHEARGPPFVDGRVAVSDLNLTDSMTSLIKSGSTSSRAWPTLTSTPTSASSQAGPRKPPTGNHRVRAPTKRSTPRLQPDDHHPTPPPPAPPGNFALRRPMSVDTLSPLKVAGRPVDIKRQQLRPALSFVFLPPQTGARHQQLHQSTTPLAPRPPPTERLLRQPLTAAMSAHGVRAPPFSPPPVGAEQRAQGELAASPVAAASSSAAPGHGPVFQQRRKRCVSQSDVRLGSPTSPASPTSTTTTDEVRPQDAAVRRHPQPRLGVNLLGRNPQQLQMIGRRKTLSLIDVTSGRRLSTADDEPPLAVWSPPRDVTNMADAALQGVAASRDSLSDEGYQTKDSGSTTSSSLKRTQFSFRGQRSPLLPAYL